MQFLYSAFPGRSWLKALYILLPLADLFNQSPAQLPREYTPAHTTTTTTYKKVFLKYQVNARFPSLCLASENAIFGGGKRKPRKKKKKVGKPIGDPVGGRDAPINLLQILLF